MDLPLSPASFAYKASGGAWIPAKHLLEVNDALIRAVSGEIDRLIITLPPRHGKLCANSTPVLTTNGWTTHGDLNTEDYVFGPGGIRTKVVATSSEDLATLDVTFLNGETITVHPNHEWTVFDKSTSQYRTVETQWILESGRLHDFTIGGRQRIWCIRQAENPEPGKCIQVDRPDGLYLVGKSLIPTHNSFLVSQYFPAWYVGTFRTKKLILTSYEATFAASWGRKARDIIMEVGQKPDMFPVPVSVSEDKASASEWELDKWGGTMSTAGAGGPITGKGANCLIGETVIETDSGKKTIAEIVDQNLQVSVLGFDLATKEKVWQKVLATQKSLCTGPLLEIHTNHGRRIFSTPEHRFYRCYDPFGDGWTEARHLKKKDQLIGQDCRKNERVTEIYQTYGTGVAVYDIQVEGTNNFFANGILAHNCFIIDDPFKNAEEANSQVARDHIWDWYTSTAYTRLEDEGVMIVIHTRWHANDLIGRLLEDMADDGDQWEILDFPALATENDILHRKPGEALWPLKFNEQKLLRIKRSLGTYWWNALYMQRPTDPEGEKFKREWFEIVQDYPHDCQKVRFWDLAATEGAGDWTSGGLIGEQDGIIYVIDMQHIQGSPQQVEALVKQTAMLDGRYVPIRMEQEGGASGKTVIDHYMRRVLLGYDFKGATPRGSKEIRANPLAALAEAGNVKLVKAPWNRGLLDELAAFPRSKNDDQVDCISGGLNEISQNEAEGEGFVLVYDNPYRIDDW